MQLIGTHPLFEMLIPISLALTAMIISSCNQLLKATEPQPEPAPTPIAKMKLVY